MILHEQLACQIALRSARRELARLRFLPRPWIEVDARRVRAGRIAGRIAGCSCESLQKIGSSIYAQGEVRHNRGSIYLPYWHKVFRG